MITKAVITREVKKDEFRRAWKLNVELFSVYKWVSYISTKYVYMANLFMQKRLTPCRFERFHFSLIFHNFFLFHREHCVSRYPNGIIHITRAHSKSMMPACIMKEKSVKISRSTRSINLVFTFPQRAFSVTVSHWLRTPTHTFAIFQYNLH